MNMQNEKEISRMKELASILTKASESYYAKDEEIMSNYEYDKLYDELEDLEQKTNIVLAGSPTTKVGYEAVAELPKEHHAKPMLSLEKTKNREELKEWLGDKRGLLSWKLDGLTVVLTYKNGALSKAVTRGNGEEGEVITNNAKVFANIPLQIMFKGTLVLRGEAVIRYSDFEKINEQMEEVSKYKNPRNLCSGSVRQLNNEITAKRNVCFFAFSLVQANGEEFGNSRKKQQDFLQKQGFEVVENKEVNADNILSMIEWFEEKIKTYDVPSDGLVLIYDDIAYGKSLGTTAKFPKDAIAFKWADDISTTTLREIEWSPSRTGLINPVAIFDPVELEGTTVSRASVHNISILRAMQLGIGDTITVYKANMIIPQIADNLTRSGNVAIPTMCPVCQAPTKITSENEVSSLYCTNPECPVKHIKALTLFVSRDALNIDGFSEATLEKFVAKGFISKKADIFTLAKYKEEIVQMDGFGEKSYQNLIESIQKAKTTTLSKLIYGLGIANIGVATAKLICRQFNDNLEEILCATQEQISQISGIGAVIAKAFCDYFKQPEKKEELDELRNYITITKAETTKDISLLSGKTFVITGSLNHFKDRSELKERIEALGGKVSGSVSSKTTALINNDLESSSSKNKTAKELGIPIVNEDEFMVEYKISKN